MVTSREIAIENRNRNEEGHSKSIQLRKPDLSHAIFRIQAS